ncbi:hypothetical protein EVAR_73713_1 [Eumeta japonica]|uniref:Uncharacterized protein n=1 Tax=Eumeta variegata TaxID=151549 RepID=A0A4C1T2Y4_EUMVA|nr:hypothetical protein EVAR_73713_1 [Eumeta japonica]
MRTQRSDDLDRQAEEREGVVELLNDERVTSWLAVTASALGQSQNTLDAFSRSVVRLPLPEAHESSCCSRANSAQLKGFEHMMPHIYLYIRSTESAITGMVTDNKSNQDLTDRVSAHPEELNERPAKTAPLSGVVTLKRRSANDGPPSAGAFPISPIAILKKRLQVSEHANVGLLYYESWDSDCTA